MLEFNRATQTANGESGQADDGKTGKGRGVTKKQGGGEADTNQRGLKNDRGRVRNFRSNLGWAKGVWARDQIFLLLIYN
jgi:hypothetical protein